MLHFFPSMVLSHYAQSIHQTNMHVNYFALQTHNKEKKNIQQRKQIHLRQEHTTDPRTYKYIYQVVIGWDMREG